MPYYKFRDQNNKFLISILNFQNYSDTISCLKQLSLSGFSSNEILVIDNHSPNDSVNKIKEAFLEVKIIESPVNNGFAAGHKIAVDYALNDNSI